MILPIYAYGQPVLKKVAEPITPDYPELATLIANMWETMYHADGVGIAAPQVGLGIRLFVIDSTQVDRKEAIQPGDEPFKRVFINAQVVEFTGAQQPFEEGCLSIPDIRGDVDRPSTVHIRWQDEKFEHHEAVFTGINARVVQHEYDHLEGKIFTDRISPIRRQLIKAKLTNIVKGKTQPRYKYR